MWRSAFKQVQHLRVCQEAFGPCIKESVFGGRDAPGSAGDQMDGEEEDDVVGGRPGGPPVNNASLRNGGSMNASLRGAAGGSSLRGTGSSLRGANSAVKAGGLVPMGARIGGARPARAPMAGAGRSMR